MTTHPALDKIELHFKMSFKDIINNLHLKNKVSIKQLSLQSKVSRAVFQEHAKRLNLPLRSIQEANKLTLNKGINHWAFGKNKSNSLIHKAHSKRMREHNPMKQNSALIKMAKSNAIHFKNNPLPQELIFKNILKSFNIKHIFQYPINRYVIDFFIPKLNLCIEIDSTHKWGKTRRNKAAIKDKFLSEKGFKILRICKKLLTDKSRIINILYTNNII